MSLKSLKTFQWIVENYWTLPNKCIWLVQWRKKEINKVYNTNLPWWYETHRAPAAHPQCCWHCREVSRSPSCSEECSSTCSQSQRWQLSCGEPWGKITRSLPDFMVLSLSLNVLLWNKASTNGGAEKGKRNYFFFFQCNSLRNISW